MDWFDELEKIVDTDPSQISTKLGISREAANHMLHAVDDYLEANSVSEEEEGGIENE
jgi:hypothetical protein